MSDKEKPLPQPPASPFGRRSLEQRGEGPIMADEIARAAAEGRLEDFVEKEMPDNEYARKLVSMMIGMTGMIPHQGLQPGQVKEERTPDSSEETGSSQRITSHVQPPADIIKAVGEGDVKELMGLLEREHKRRAGSPEKTAEADMPGDSGMPALETETIDKLIKIASENDLTLDWIILRALRLYIQEYQRTGRL